MQINKMSDPFDATDQFALPADPQQLSPLGNDLPEEPDLIPPQLTEEPEHIGDRVSLNHRQLVER